MAYLFALGALLAGWQTIAGFHDGQIAAMGHDLVNAKRSTQPTRFWLIFGFNLLFFIGFLGLFFYELKP